MSRTARAAGAVVIGLGLIGSSAANAVPIYNPAFTSSIGSDTETFTADTGFHTTDFLAQFDIPKFNSVLGTLTGISVRLSGSMKAIGSITNSGAGPAGGVGISQNSTVTDNPPQPIAGSFGASVLTGSFNGDNFLKVTTSARATASVGTLAPAATTGDIPLTAAFTTRTASQTSAFDTNLIGIGTFSVTLATGEFTTAGGSGGNLSAAATTMDDLIVAVTYTFLAPIGGPPPIPEPMSLTLIGTGLVGIGVVVRRRRLPHSF